MKFFPTMPLRTLYLLHAERMKRGDLIDQLLKMMVPDPHEIDSWVMAVFAEDPNDEELQTRIFLVFGGLKDCAESVAGCLTRKPKPSARLRILSFQGQVPEIDCRANDFCF
jgi:hypothetical protein